MPNNIVLCFDGTNNEYAAVNTNVVKIYAMAERARDDQFMYYQPGIGTMAPSGMWGGFKRWFVTRLDLAIAWLLEQHVSDGYRFLMRYYCPGDRIFLFGFSRGAYTARVLAAMIHRVGLLSRGNEELISFAWDMYRRKVDDEIPVRFKDTFSRAIPIHFVGVWDTVSSVGWMWNPSYLQYTRYNPSVSIFRHAIALDERRAYFRANTWADKQRPAHQDVSEQWFSGVHCDVGGGYDEKDAGLSKIALRWMVDEAKNAGLCVNAQREAEIIPRQDTANYSAPNVSAMQHESLKGFWWIAECFPKRYRDPSKNFQERLIIPLGRSRTVPPNAVIHPSVQARMAAVTGYRPSNLPSQPRTT